MILPHISRRTRILLLLPPIVLMSVVCLGSLFIVIYNTLFFKPTEVLEFVAEPDADGKLTFRGPTYQFRAWPAEVISAWIVTDNEFPFVVDLSIDRRQLGTPEAPIEDRIICRPNGVCTDTCHLGSPCEDIADGWYDVEVVPPSQSYWVNYPPFNFRPEGWTGLGCVDPGKAGLELCPDSGDKTAPGPLMPAIEGADPGVWFSTERDAAGYPMFVAACANKRCRRIIERDGALLRITFSFKELENWQRFNAGLRDFAARLIEPLPGGRDRNHQ